MNIFLLSLKAIAVSCPRGEQMSVFQCPEPQTRPSMVISGGLDSISAVPFLCNVFSLKAR